MRADLAHIRQLAIDAGIVPPHSYMDWTRCAHDIDQFIRSRWVYQLDDKHPPHVRTERKISWENESWRDWAQEILTGTIVRDDCDSMALTWITIALALGLPAERIMLCIVISESAVLYARKNRNDPRKANYDHVVAGFRCLEDPTEFPRTFGDTWDLEVNPKNPLIAQRHLLYKYMAMHEGFWRWGPGYSAQNNNEPSATAGRLAR